MDKKEKGGQARSHNYEIGRSEQTVFFTNGGGGKKKKKAIFSTRGEIDLVFRVGPFSKEGEKREGEPVAFSFVRPNGDDH